MKRKNLMLLAGAAAFGAYSAIYGKGLFNKPRFKEQHDAISRYVDAHYPGARYTPIEATEKGYVTVIKRFGYNNILLYAYKSQDNIYIFHESEIRNG